MEKIRNDRKVEPYETVQIRKDGSTFPLLMTISPIHDESGLVIGASAIARDITGEKEALQYARDLLESAPDAMIIVDKSGTIVNSQTEKLFGYHREEMLGQLVELLLPSRFHAKHSIHMGHFFADSSHRSMGSGVELFGEGKDGREFPVEISLGPIKTADGLLVVAAIRDITKEKEASQNARDMASMIASSHDAIASMSLEGLITSWNPAAEHIYGYTAEEIVGQPASLLIPVENTHELAENQSKIRDGNRIAPYETLRIRKDGITIPIFLTISPIRDESGVAVGASAIARDITADKQIIRQLEEINVLRSEFVAIVAHDLRAPMASISGFAHLLIDEWSDTNDGEKIEYLQIIARNTENLANFVEDVLQVARMEAGEYTYDIGSFDIRVLAQRALDEAIGPSGDRRFELIAPDGLPLVLGDEERQWQVLTNLLSNALKFSPAPEPITVELSTIEGFVRVGVIDRGIGIAKEDLAKLFRKSGRLVKLGNPITPGNGLGLFIAKTLVEAQGGRIWCESAPGVGSTFFFTIPVAQ